MTWNTTSVLFVFLLVSGAFSYAAFIFFRLKTQKNELLKRNTHWPDMDHLPGMIFRCKHDEKWTFLFANQAARLVTGCPPETLVRGEMTYMCFVHPEDQQRLRENFQQALEKKTLLSHQYRMVADNGKIRWVDTEAQGVYSEDGALLFFEGWTRDISKQKENERRSEVIRNVGAACLQAAHHEPMLEEVLHTVLKGFGADRAWLIHPDALEERGYRLVKAADRPGLGQSDENAPDFIPMNPARCQQVLASEGVLKCDTETAWPREDPRTGDHRSMICTAIKTKSGKPRILGMHYCTGSHCYSKEEVTLFEEISEQITHALSSVLSIKKLTKSDYIQTEAQRIAHIGIWDLDIIDNLLTWSDEIYRIFGLEPKQFEATYEAFLKLVHPEDRETVDRTYTQSVINKTPYNITHRLLLADGTLKYVNEQCETFYDDSGKAVRSFGIVQDITEQKKVEEKLRQSLLAVNSTEDAIAIMDEKNEIIEVNEAYSKITGYAREEVLGKKTGLLRSGKHADSFYDMQSRDLRRKGVWQGEVWKRRKNGELFPSWATITTVRDPEKKVVNYVSVFSDVSPAKHAQKKFNFFTHYDPLTELPNHMLFKDRLHHALQRARREEKQLAVILLDLDYFNKINARLGHPVGDLILKQVAKRIKASIRDEDTVARLGGDQFVIIMEKMSRPQGVAGLVKKLKAAFDQSFSVEKEVLRISVSVGISLYPQDAKGHEGLLKNANAAMLRAKKKGRNKFQFSTPSLSLATFEHLNLEKALHQALAENELILHYQAQYSLKTDRVTNAEALVRWNHPEFGLIFPDQFIPFAEESGLILPIEAWVLETACAQMEDWLKQGHPLERISVNLSSVQFQRGDIIKTVSQTLEKTGLPAKRLEIEIKENALIQGVKHTIGVLDELSGSGVHILIDNFGTGYFSLSHLKKLPIHRLKIDKSFVRDLPKNTNDAAITRAINAIGQNLQIDVIAEGVETKAQHAFLQSLGCNEAQGYLYHRPILGDPAASFLRKL